MQSAALVYRYLIQIHHRLHYCIHELDLHQDISALLQVLEQLMKVKKILVSPNSDNNYNPYNNDE